jgi:hypothetical protein
MSTLHDLAYTSRSLIYVKKIEKNLKRMCESTVISRRMAFIALKNIHSIIESKLRTEKPDEIGETESDEDESSDKDYADEDESSDKDYADESDGVEEVPTLKKEIEVVIIDDEVEIHPTKSDPECE